MGRSAVGFIFECGHGVPVPVGMVRPTRTAVALAHEKECETYRVIMRKVRLQSIDRAAATFRGKAVRS